MDPRASATATAMDPRASASASAAATTHHANVAMQQRTTNHHHHLHQHPHVMMMYGNGAYSAPTPSAMNPFGSSLARSGLGASSSASSAAALVGFPPAYAAPTTLAPGASAFGGIGSSIGGVGHHLAAAAYPSMAPSAHAHAMYASALTPRVLLAAGEAPVYVNARQYQAILRRRRARARDEARRAGAQRKTYASRSAHAKNRIRGADGTFLTREELLAGAGGPEAQARARAREAELAELEVKRAQKRALREAKAAAKAAAKAKVKAVKAAKEQKSKIS